jgi:histidyl-tRNA synthetase
MDRKFDTPKGFFDRVGDEAGRLSDVQGILFEQARLYGAKELRIAPVGFEETYFADTNLDPEKTYQLKDKSDRTLVLNCDSLPAVMRSYVASNREKMSRSMFSIPVFRYRNTKLRHYHHLGVSFINDEISERNETVIPRILIETLRRITSKKIHVVMNEFRLWISLFALHGFSQKDTRDYLFYRRFHHGKEKPTAEQAVVSVVQRVEATPALVDVLSALHSEQPKEFEDQRGQLQKFLPSEITSPLGSYYDRIATLKELPGVETCTFDLNDYHSSEFFSALGYQLYLEGEEKRLADGGSYHEYGAKFSPRIRSVYSGIIRHDDLLDHDDKLRRPKTGLGVYVMTERGIEAEQMIARLRAKGVPILEDTKSKGIRKAAAYFREEGFSHFVVLGDNELNSGVFKVTNMQTNEDVQITIDSPSSYFYP